MDRSLRAARLATFVFFALNGFVMGMWIVHIPVVERRTGISHAVLGSLLLLLGVGAFAGMRLCGALADRYGGRRIVPAGAALCSAAVVLPGLAGDAWTLGGALFALGFGNGCLDVAMNTHAVQVERGYGRPVMSAFHAVFSVGGVLAALAGAAVVGRGWGPAATLAGVAVFGLVVTALAAPALLPPEPAPAGLPRAASGRRVPARVWALAALALLLMLCEGVANDWSVLHLRNVLDAPAGTAALAYGAFSTAMTLGRLVTDRVAARFGPVRVVRYGAALAAAGLAVTALTGWVALALTGWAVFGLGLSGCVPQLFSAAGHVDRATAGANVSRVAGLGYLGMLAGPTSIGQLTHVMPLNLAFFLPVAFCVVAVGAAGTLRPPADPAP
ncbi:MULTISPECIES: MFS transporter [Streptomycetaceae]|uniref:Major facilitator superfamily MFS_1 n=1 Tax=Streptantibioticus cattleyicolor (strain ATCC 35852 / DSM 46488 / JCM 4925 / NBRC 14057 / NRRL 8057) TaxID=1003195 RepID=F8JQI8_STREN|nr:MULTISPECIES: MFS transporter [Streptomycetaceae]AEW97831.1 major facilitator superfamily MFS_1 [Streptantibioticus cattleyicolor NRRL 8057 = DSM 46488]MYS62247.1 MFS transporter [Streptomyces sp. SID5468]CCB78150.1 Major facilitator superfamily MFS_1 [Streptantibioticus cattleyicolor NRRL 8057 = DSM 46488]